MSQFKKAVFPVAMLALAFVLVAGVAGAQDMKKPETVTISGKLVDLSCAAKGQAMMGSDTNAINDDHMTPDGKIANCATMCLKGGQPAGIYSDGKLTATLLANASLNLYKFAAKDVEVMGFWAGKKEDKTATFMPAKIRVKGTKEWTEVQTKQMH
ncbi:MAG: hypothetical protein QGD90_12480 [Candidatus Hydrogenedentes bacterium]|nr:hypothetical protein [Candidatus Hydrogenedentota bacterium]